MTMLLSCIHETSSHGIKFGWPLQIDKPPSPSRCLPPHPQSWQWPKTGSLTPVLMLQASTIGEPAQSLPVSATWKAPTTAEVVAPADADESAIDDCGGSADQQQNHLEKAVLPTKLQCSTKDLARACQSWSSLCNSPPIKPPCAK